MSGPRGVRRRSQRNRGRCRIRAPADAILRSERTLGANDGRHFERKSGQLRATQIAGERRIRLRRTRWCGLWSRRSPPGRPTGFNPANKLSATETKPAQLRWLQSAEEQRVRLDRSGWEPGGRRFKSCLPDQKALQISNFATLPVSSFSVLEADQPGVHSGINFGAGTVPSGLRFGSGTRITSFRWERRSGPEPGGRRLRDAGLWSRRSRARFPPLTPHEGPAMQGLSRFGPSRSE